MTIDREELKQRAAARKAIFDSAASGNADAIIEGALIAGLINHEQRADYYEIKRQCQYAQK